MTVIDASHPRAIGNSSGVVLPKEIAGTAEREAGRQAVRRVRRMASRFEAYDEDFAEQMDSGARSCEDRNILRELAK
ncbi:MAG: AbrB/MazE/SpoVT family DNA-binding domain-containing protein [Xanthomonadales bacterium]|nr:AbrB/MazE/SpoVT family DNA-binding domain-containing protein [Xanthomonadales bacterium]